VDALSTNSDRTSFHMETSVVVADLLHGELEEELVSLPSGEGGVDMTITFCMTKAAKRNAVPSRNKLCTVPREEESLDERKEPVMLPSVPPAASFPKLATRCVFFWEPLLLLLLCVNDICFVDVEVGGTRCGAARISPASTQKDDIEVML